MRIGEKRIFSTAAALGRLVTARVKLTGCLEAGQLAAKIRLLGNPEIIRNYELRGTTINLSAISVQSFRDQLDLKGGGDNITGWLVDKLKVYGGSSQLEKILQRIGISRSQLEQLLAEELLRQTNNLAAKTLVCSDKESAAALVQHQVKDFIELANLSEAGDADFVNFIANIMTKATQKHHPATAVHSGVVAFYSAEMAAAMGLSPDDKLFQRIKTAGLLHDIGKLGLDPDILDRPEPAPQEKLLLDEHLALSVYLLSEIRWLKNVVPIIQHHHDNKKNYPVWLREGELTAEARFGAKILIVADGFDGMTSKRPYKLARNVYSREQALAILGEEGCDRGALDALKSVIGKAEKHIYGLKINFSQNELTLVWYGIEHIIKKSVLPSEGGGQANPDADGYLRKERPLLWLLSGRQLIKENAAKFIADIKNEVMGRLNDENLLAKFTTMKAAAMDDLFMGVLFKILYRALKADERLNSNSFAKAARVIAYYSEDADPSRLAEVVDQLRLEEKQSSEEYFRWISLSLLGEDATQVPLVGEGAFVTAVDEIFAKAKANGLTD
jgi:putative nucleotidyltransferase with HDIG domain